MNKNIQTSILLMFSLLLIGNGCTFNVSNENTTPVIVGQPTTTPVVDEENVTDVETNAKTLISTRASEVILALKNGDSLKLSAYAHPEKGVRFSPYVYVKKNSDLVFKADVIKNLLNDTKVYTWGTTDGSGFPIELTAKEYFKEFVYSHDFAIAPEVTYNKISNENTKKLLSAYPDSIIVEYYFPGFDPKFEGMDWESLRLVFEEFNGTWYLVGIVHDQWMI